MEAEKKTCSICRLPKLTSDYRRNGSRLRSSCRTCCNLVEAAQRKKRMSDPEYRKSKNDIAAEWRAKNPGKLAEYKERYRLKPDPQSKPVSKRDRKQYRAANKQRLAEQQKESRKRNKAVVLQKAKAYRDSLPEPVVIAHIRQYSPSLNKSNIPKSLIEAKRAHMLLRRLIKGSQDEER